MGFMPFNYLVESAMIQICNLATQRPACKLTTIM